MGKSNTFLSIWKFFSYLPGFPWGILINNGSNYSVNKYTYITEYSTLTVPKLV